MDLEQRRSRAEQLRHERAREYRRATVAVELRSAGDTLTLDGYASITDKPYDMGWYSEQIRSGAFSKTLGENPDVQLLINHEGLPLARTLSGTLRLDEDTKGLHVEADLDPADPDVSSLARKMERGDIDQMSFAFRAIRQEWDEDYTDRQITELSIDRGDVSVVNQGANPFTSAQVREFASALVELRAGKTLSADTMQTLQRVLDLVSDADDDVDEAQEVLADLMGVPNPDDDTDTSSDSDDAEGEDNRSQVAAEIARLKAKSRTRRLALTA